jgi:8-oxo-dGTP pyrophosphatase MutT (NUDIX family)
LENFDYVVRLWNEMTEKERGNILSGLSGHFDEIWDELWNYDNSRDRSIEKEASREKLSKVDFGLLRSREEDPWPSPEWGFPKGRKRFRENDLSAAKREFQEETNVDASNICITRHILEERFTGSNGVKYYHKYFVAIPSGEIPTDIVTKQQLDEIEKVEWVPLGLATERIRTYQKHRKELLGSLITMENDIFN